MKENPNFVVNLMVLLYMAIVGQARTKHKPRFPIFQTFQLNEYFAHLPVFK